MGLRAMASDLALRVCVAEQHGERRYPDCPHPDCRRRREVLVSGGDYFPTESDLRAQGELT